MKSSLSPLTSWLVRWEARQCYSIWRVAPISELDPVGTRVWQLVEQGNTLAEVRDAMLDEFDVSRELLERDILALAADLAEKQLIVSV